MKRKGLWLALILLAVMTLGVGLLVWNAHRLASNTIARHRADLLARTAAISAQDFGRPPLEGEGQPGNAWDLYRQFFDAVDQLTQEEQDAIPEVGNAFLEPDESPDDHLLNALYTRFAPDLEKVREALRRREVNPGYAYHEGYSMQLPDLGRSIQGAKFLAGAVSHYHRTGDDRAAADAAVLGLGLAQDMGRAGPVVTALGRLVSEGSVLESCRTLLSEHALTAADLAAFAGRLDALDRHRSSLHDSWEIEDLFVRGSYANVEDREWLRNSGLFGETPLPGWKYLFSIRIARAQALNEADSFLRCAGELRALSGWEQTDAGDKLAAGFTDHSNPLVRMLMPTLARSMRREAVTLMSRTLLRVAVALAWYEAEKGSSPAALADLVPRYLPKVPTCPLTGKPLGYSPGKVWSVGVDGTDDGGTPHPQGDDEKAGGDVVWPVKRK